MSFDSCEVIDLGLVDYLSAWELQNSLAEEIGLGKRLPALLLLEHPHTYTFGKRSDPKNLIWNEAELRQRSIQVHWVDRGGDVTYHGPGQLVGYPLLPLGPATIRESASGTISRLPQADYVGYVRHLERTIILTLAQFGLRGEQKAGLTGVWVDPPCPNLASSTLPAKIAAIGVKVDARGISRHGFALNVAPDMSYWDGIIGCGLAGYRATSLAELLAPAPAMAQVKKAICTAFGEIFHCQMFSTMPIE